MHVDEYIRQFSAIMSQMINFTETTSKFPEIWRVFISGSSSSGKTHFAKQLLANKLFDYERIYYYHPDLGEEHPVNWSDLNVPIRFQAGLPSRDELLNTSKLTCLVIDDLFTEACKSQDISYLFRVLSSKKKLHVIIMTQRYFAETGMNIRNSSNFHVLMNNVDVRTNKRVACTMGLKAEFKLAEESNRHSLYPYVFIDRTNEARVRNLQVYTDIFSRYKQVIFNRMKCYIVPEADFKANFKVIDNHLAVKNANKKRSTHKSSESEDSSTNTDSSSSTDLDEQREAIRHKIRKALHRRSKYTKL